MGSWQIFLWGRGPSPELNAFVFTRVISKRQEWPLALSQPGLCCRDPCSPSLHSAKWKSEIIWLGGCSGQGSQWALWAQNSLVWTRCRWCFPPTILSSRKYCLLNPAWLSLEMVSSNRTHWESRPFIVFFWRFLWWLSHYLAKTHRN